MVERRYPWHGKASTCGRCNGPFEQPCIDGKRACLRIKITWPISYPCAACGQTVSTWGPMPKVWEDEAWRKIQVEHAPTCAWASTKGYLVGCHSQSLSARPA